MLFATGVRGTLERASCWSLVGEEWNQCSSRAKPVDRAVQWPVDDGRRGTT